MNSGQTADIVFFGTEDFSLYSLTALVEAGFPIALVITKPDTARGRTQTLTAPAVKTYANQHDIPVLQPTAIANIIPTVQALKHPVGVLVSYGRIIPQSIIDLFTPGIINVHPSLLPRYRGPSPIESAILHQDSQTAVSIMQLSKAMDAGPVYKQTLYPLTGRETRPELYEALGALGAKQLVACLPSIQGGSLLPIPQDDTQATYCQLLRREDSVLDPTKLTAAQADAHIRAYLGYPGSRLHLGAVEVIVTRSHVSATPTELSITCSDGNYLVIEQLKPVGKKEMPARAFLAGYKV